MSNALKRMLLVNVACMGGATFFIYLNAYLLGNGLEEYHIGLCDGGFWIVSVLLQPWLGPQLDKRGRILFLRAGLILLMAAALGYALVPPRVEWIFPLRVLQGAGFALYLTSAWAWISDHAPPEKMHSIFGIFGVSSLVGSIIGPVAANLIRRMGAPLVHGRTGAGGRQLHRRRERPMLLSSRTIVRDPRLASRNGGGPKRICMRPSPRVPREAKRPPCPTLPR